MRSTGITGDYNETNKSKPIAKKAIAKKAIAKQAIAKQAIAKKVIMKRAYHGREATFPRSSFYKLRHSQHKVFLITIN